MTTAHTTQETFDVIEVFANIPGVHHIMSQMDGCPAFREASRMSNKCDAQLPDGEFLNNRVHKLGPITTTLIVRYGIDTNYSVLTP